VIIARNRTALPRVLKDGLRVPVSVLAEGDEPPPEPA